MTDEYLHCVQSVIDLLGDAVLLVDPVGLVRAANPAAEQLLVAGGGELVGRPMVELVAEPSLAAYKSAWDDVWVDVWVDAPGKGLRTAPDAARPATPLSVLRADGRAIQLEVALARIGQRVGEFAVAVVLRADSGMARDALLRQLAVAHRSQRFLLDAATAIMAANGYRETLRSLAAVAVPTLGDMCLIDVVDERGGLARVAAAHNDPAHADLVAELRRAYPPDPAGSHPSVQAMRERQSVWGRDVTDDFLRRATRDPRHLEILRTLEITSFMAVPLIAGDEVLGCLSLLCGRSGRTLGPDDVALAEQLARQVAQVIAKQRRYDAVRAVSHTLQASLLPTEAPHIERLDIAVRYVPGTRDAEVGGDFWDVVQLPLGKVAILIGDVTGHDAVAAATMAQLRSVCRALRPSTQSPADLIDALQRTWDQLGLERVATASFADLDPATGVLRIASAGHTAPILVIGETASVVEVDPAPPLGAPASPAANWLGELPVGATLVFYTDGLVEDRYRDVEDGIRRLVSTAVSARVTDAAELADRLLTCIPDDDRSDDVALLVVRRTAG